MRRVIPGSVGGPVAAKGKEEQGCKKQSVLVKHVEKLLFMTAEEPFAPLQHLPEVTIKTNATLSSSNCEKMTAAWIVQLD